jgi:hypothetical protein
VTTARLTDLADQLRSLADIALAKVTDVDTDDALAFVEVAQSVTTLLDRVARCSDAEARATAGAHLDEITATARRATTHFLALTEGPAE